MIVRDKKKYDPSFREESVRLVLTSGRPVNQVAAGIVAAGIGVKPSTLGNWVRQYREANLDTTGAADVRCPVAWEEHQRALTENAKLKAEVEFLGKVSAFCAAKQR